MAEVKKIKKIIFITLTNIGDVVLTIPSLDYLKHKFKDAVFTVLCGQHASVLFANDPRIQEVIAYNKHIPFREKFTLFNRLRKERFDGIIDLRDTIFRWVTPATFHNPYISKIPFSIRHLRLRHLYKTMSALGEQDQLSNLEIDKTSICIDKQIVDSASRLLIESRLSADVDDFIVVAPGAHSNTKRWELQRFVNACEQLLEKNIVVLMGDKQDSAITQEVNRRLGNRCIDLAGKTSLLEAIAIIKKSRLVICNDSSISHFASYFDIPMIVIFGPTDEEKYGPWSKSALIVRKNTICSPCGRDDCDKDKLCLNIIAPETIVESAYLLLEKKTTQPSLPFRRILVTRTDRLGDVLLSTPLISNLRKYLPGAHIAMLVQSALADVVKQNPYLDEVILLDKKGKHKSLINLFRLTQELRKKRFDLALILHPTARMHIVSYLAVIPRRIGYDRKWGFLNTRILRHEKQVGSKHESDYALDFLRELGLSNFDQSMYMPIHKESEIWVSKVLKESSKDNGVKVVAIHTQASCKSKLWPESYFNCLIEKIKSSYKVTIVYVGSELDSAIKESDNIINLTGKTSVAQLTSILKHSDLFISNDSGPVHVAVAVGTPVISIFGRKQPGLGPKRWGPTGGEKSAYLHKDAGCQVCLAHDCENNFACLRSIEPSHVMEHVDRFLSENRS